MKTINPSLIWLIPNDILNPLCLLRKPAHRGSIDPIEKGEYIIETPRELNWIAIDYLQKADNVKMLINGYLHNVDIYEFQQSADWKAVLKTRLVFEVI